MKIAFWIWQSFSILKAPPSWLDGSRVYYPMSCHIQIAKGKSTKTNRLTHEVLLPISKCPEERSAAFLRSSNLCWKKASSSSSFIPKCSVNFDQQDGFSCLKIGDRVKTASFANTIDKSPLKKLEGHLRRSPAVIAAKILKKSRCKMNLYQNMHKILSKASVVCLKKSSTK